MITQNYVMAQALILGNLSYMQKFKTQHFMVCPHLTYTGMFFFRALQHLVLSNIPGHFLLLLLLRGYLASGYVK